MDRYINGICYQRREPVLENKVLSQLYEAANSQPIVSKAVINNKALDAVFLFFLVPTYILDYTSYNQEL